MLPPQLAVVRPRVISPVTGDAVLLVDEIVDSLERGERGPFGIVGPLGSGKSTALAHVAAALGAERGLRYVDEEDRCLVATSAVDSPAVRLQMAPWTDDEIIEYLLAAHPAQCRSVMRRLQADDFHRQLRGRPELLRPVLDHLAFDVPGDLRSILRGVVHGALADPQLQPNAAAYCLDLAVGRLSPAETWRTELISQDCPMRGLRLIGHSAVFILLACDELASVLQHTPDVYFTETWPDELIREFGRQVKQDPAAQQRLRELLAGDASQLHARSASVLFAAGVDWKPNEGMLLSGARLNGVKWTRVSLRHVFLNRASLIGADLSKADLQEARLNSAQLSGANLTSAILFDARLTRANLARANLTGANARFANFRNAKLHQATLDDAFLERALFHFANLTGASLAGANLVRSSFAHAKIEDADFRGANLYGAHLDGLPLRKARLEGVNLEFAWMRCCDLESVHLPSVNLERARLGGALLTGSCLPRANLRYADLRNAGLADVEWEEVDLRGADLRGCSFHMGSSRSGRVGSPYPSHGTRTGFYTDSYDDRYHKPPEEIRKANLRGADLRGADIFDVDFYLVDLRDALYDDEQANHFRCCDAILEELV